MSKARRFEIWTDLECNSGARAAFLSRDAVVSASRTQDVNGRDILEFSMQRSAEQWAEIQERRILRVHYEDDSITEHRIARKIPERRSDGSRIGSVQAVSILDDLNNGVLQRPVLAVTFTLLSFTRDNLMDFIIDDAPSYFAKGTVDGSTNIVERFTFDADSPLSALQRLAEVTELEVAIRRNGATNYLVDLITQVGSSAVVPEFRYAKNLLALGRTSDTSEMTNFLHAFGSNEGGVRSNMTGHLFTVATTASVDADSRYFTLEESDVIVEDDALNGYGASRIRHGTTDIGYLIEDTTRSNGRIQVTSEGGGDPDIQVGDSIQITLTKTVLQPIWWVESPASQATYGIVKKRVVHDDLIEAANLLSNPTLRSWTGGVPDDWTLVGSPSVTQVTTEQYTRFGGSSFRYDSATADLGIKQQVNITPTTSSPYFSCFIVVYNESADGLRAYLEWSDGTDTFQSPEASTNVQDVWVELLIEGIEIPTSMTTMTLYVLAQSTSSTPWYLDAAQITQTSVNREFIEGRSGNVLWQRAVREVRRAREPTVSYEIEAKDLTAIDPTNYPYDALTIGGNLKIVDRDLSVNETLRLARIRRNVMTGADVSLDVETFGEQ